MLCPKARELKKLSKSISLPIAILLLLVTLFPTFSPIAIFPFSIVFEGKVLYPIAILSAPIVLLDKEDSPIAMLSAPVKLFN
jgi:hypothetical protein